MIVNEEARASYFIIIIGPQGTSMCSRGPRVRRIPYKSGQFFWTFFLGTSMCS